MATTWMCDNGNHGTPERRYVGATPSARFANMYQGNGCAGSVYSIMTNEESDCDCDCHSPVMHTHTRSEGMGYVYYDCDGSYCE